MTPNPTALIDLADRHGTPVVDRWGRSRIVLADGFDLDELDDLSRRDGYSITAFLGEERIAIPMGQQRPDPVDQARAAALATLDRISNEVTGASNGTAVVELLKNEIDEIEVIFAHPQWARTMKALTASLEEDWPSLADTLVEGTVEVGDCRITLRPLVTGKEGPRSGLPITVPEGRRPSYSCATAWDAFMAVGDAAAWTNIAIASRRTASGVLLALHHDQDPTIELTLANAEGGVDLFRWWTASADGNREEALRYVLRIVTAARSTLPEPRTVLRLAERQHIALTRENAADVHRAITEGQRDTTDAMKDATDAFGDLVEESTKTANATIIAVLGLIALVARSANDLPQWLVGVVALAAIAGVAAVVRSRLGRIDDHKRAVEQLMGRLEDDPLLPDEDRNAALEELRNFGLTARAGKARRTVVGLGVSAAFVVLAAAIWLIFFHEPSSAVGSTSTPTNSTVASVPPTTTVATSTPVPVFAPPTTVRP